MEIKRHSKPKPPTIPNIIVNKDKSLTYKGKRYYPKEFWEHTKR